jgi:hypothetical protein
MRRPALASTLLAFIVVAVVIVGSLAFLAVQTGVGTATTTSTQQTVQSTTSAEGLRLSLSVTPSETSSGGSITVDVSDFNTLTATNTPTIIGTPTAGGTTLNPGPCSQLPLGFGIWQGYYSVGNLSAAPPLDLFQPGTYSCPAEFSIAYFSFSPLGDSVSLYSPQPARSGNATVPTEMWTMPDAFAQNFSGYWTGQGVFRQFQSGFYTLVGGDDYGQLAIIHFYIGQPATTSTSTTSSQSSTSSSSQVPPPSSGENLSASSIQGLELMVSTNATEISAGESVQVNLSEFNSLSVANNVSAAHDWLTSVALGPCENIYVQPFGIAVYVGHVDAQNLSQGERVNIFPPTACPQYVRLVTGYEFQPMSDLAVVLPSLGAAPSPLVGSVNVGMSYTQQQHPLPPGSYTIVAADEWGTLAFAYFTVL